MGLKATKRFLILLTVLGVVLLTAGVQSVSSSYASTGPGPCPNGDGDAPGNGSPKPVAATNAVNVGSTMQASGVDKRLMVRMMMESFLNQLLGRPGFVR